MKRTHNEDAFEILDDQRLYLVADGMGGHAAGEVASRLALDTLRDFFIETSKDPDKTWPYRMDRSLTYEENRLITGIKLANLRIHESARKDQRLHKMGTTLAGLFVVDEGVLVAHVGDSRVYRLRQGKLELLTEDHSLLNEHIKRNNPSKEEIANFQFKNIIVRALGMNETVKVDTRLDIPQAGDIYLVCSDGLSGPVTDPEIAEVAQSTNDLRGIASRLIERANQNGGPDNITAVVCKWIGRG